MIPDRLFRSRVGLPANGVAIVMWRRRPVSGREGAGVLLAGVWNFVDLIV